MKKKKQKNVKVKSGRDLDDLADGRAKYWPNHIKSHDFPHKHKHECPKYIHVSGIPLIIMNEIIKWNRMKQTKGPLGKIIMKFQ